MRLGQRVDPYTSWRTAWRIAAVAAAVTLAAFAASAAVGGGSTGAVAVLRQGRSLALQLQPQAGLHVEAQGGQAPGTAASVTAEPAGHQGKPNKEAADRLATPLPPVRSPSSPAQSLPLPAQSPPPPVLSAVSANASQGWQQDVAVQARQQPERQQQQSELQQRRPQVPWPLPPPPRTLADALSAAAAGDLAAITALVAQPAPIAGRVQKQGVPAVFDRGLLLYSSKTALNLPPEQWTPPVREWLDVMLRYVNASAAASPKATDATAGLAAAEELDPALRSPMPTCLFLVDHKYRVIYARTTKTGGTTASRSLGLIPVGSNPGWCRANPEECYRYCKGLPLCLNRTMDVEELRPIWKDYLVFGVARNPFSRAVSSWSYSNLRFMRKDSRCIDTFQSFAAMPSAYVVPCIYDEGVEWRHVLNHIEPQGECMFTHDGKPAIDFLLRTEQLQEDMQALIRVINERLPPGVSPVPVDTRIDAVNINEEVVGHGTVAQRAMGYAGYYMGVAARAISDIRRYYKPDLDALGYELT